MEKINDGGPAFPQDLQGRRGDDPQYQGMTLRDWFAGKALEGQAHRFDHPHNHRELLAKDCYEIADAMLKEREASNDPGA